MSAQSNGLVSSAAQNEAGGASVRNRSKFPLSYSFYNTERFGEYVPFFVEEGVSGDTLPLHSTHEVRSYTLNAPLMQSLLKKKDFFAVPMSAILPLNWEKFYTNPVIGEDVPNDVGCGVENFWDRVGVRFVNSVRDWNQRMSDDSSDTSTNLARDLFRMLVFFEYFYSTGSLMESLGISGHSHVKLSFTTSVPNTSFIAGKEFTWDDIFDACCAYLFPNDRSSYIDVKFGSQNYRVNVKSDYVPADEDHPSITPREFIEMLRDDLASFDVIGFNTGFPSQLNQCYQLFSRLNIDISSALVNTDPRLNLSRLWAYQLVCAHYYSNDHVDFVFSAELFRQYICQLLASASSADGDDLWSAQSFSVNGFSYLYDSLSAQGCSFVLDFSTDIFGFESDIFAYFTALLSYKHSLRYMDYFTGARSQPLAVGDASVDVNSNKVDVLDLSRSRMMAKFLQAVNRSGRKFGAYMKELFGKVPAPDYHNPFYLAHTSDVVGTSENQNTADGQREQNAFTSNFITNASRYVFEYQPDRDCIVIGITYYDIPRVYTKATERQNFFIDRFDMFNPYMQFIGDQSIYQAELGFGDDTEFGYQNRHMEYKQRYNQAAGGFANPSTQLDNWVFIGDVLRRRYLPHISPSFIRSMPSELDHFYTSLSGWSLGSYFHFIVRYDNRQDASRPMAYAPVIA